MEPQVTLFVAGSTGAVGRTVVRLADRRGIRLVPHIRPRRAKESSPDPRAAVLELADSPALVAAMQGCTTVLQLIGTMRKRFSSGDTYETSDIATTRHLVDAGRRAGVRHFILLSSVGAGRAVGAYLRAKAEAERIVRESALPFTIFRPSAFMGEGHPEFPRAAWLTRTLGLHTFRPIRVEELAAALIWVALRGAPLNSVVEGASLWEQVEAARNQGIV